MSKKYEALAKELVKDLGGKENINQVYHCQTRLRFTLANEKIVDGDVVGNIEGVVKVVRNAGVYQVVIGVHVADVFEEVEKLVDIKDSAAPKAEKGNLFETIVNFVAGVFQPVIPALSGAGMVKALLALLVVFNVISNDSQTYYLLNLFADGVFYFLPIILAFTTAQKVKCNPILAVSVAAMMLHPNWTALVTAGDPVNFFGVIPFTLTKYASSVIPIILVVSVQPFVEKRLKKIVPKSAELVFVPMFTFIIMGTLAFSVLGPIGSIIGGYLADFFTFLSETAAWAPSVLIGGLLPIMVMFGLHNGVAPLGVMQLADLGYDSIFGPGCICSNMAQATAGAVVAFRTKNKQTRAIASSGAITAYMGPTEPILYGVNLPKKYPLISAMIGGACGGLYAGLTHTHRFATGSSGLPAVLLYLGNDTAKFFINIIIAIIITMVVTAFLTFILSFKFEKDEKSLVNTAKNLPEENVWKKETEVKNTIDAKKITITSPVNGTVLPLSKAEDEAFASEALGKGVVVIPKDGKVTAPFDAVVEAVFPTNHVIGLKSDAGAEVMIHVGINTVDLKGKGFKGFASQGEHVKAGDVLIEFDREGIKAAGFSDQVMVIVTNSSDYSEVRTNRNIEANGSDPIITLIK